MSVITNARHRLIAPRHAMDFRKPALLIILKSLDGENEWAPVPPDEVPAFCKRPDVVRRMIGGEMVQLESKSEYWYRAEEQLTH